MGWCEQLGVPDSFETNHHANPWRETSTPMDGVWDLTNPPKTMLRFLFFLVAEGGKKGVKIRLE